jgi:hypothetical protein
MTKTLHTFHIPVMGTGHSADTPIRLAHFGISSVISIVDDLLLEKLRKYYCEKRNLPYQSIPKGKINGRSDRITAYLNLVQDIVQEKMAAVRKEPFFQDNDKRKYFEMLPDTSPVRQEYDRLMAMPPGPERDEIADRLSRRMRPGDIDVNIMVKLDRPHLDSKGAALGEDYTDAKTALKGFADSKLSSSLVFSAGINKSLFRYMTRFKDFYRDTAGHIKKRIILKVSDFRSSQVQGRFLAQNGLEVSEYRIESGLNCGGHAFASNGILLPSILKEFKENRERLNVDFTPLIIKYYEKMGWPTPVSALTHRSLVTVQGGIGNSGEDRRLRENFGMDRTGWGTPFLLVPEATCVDRSTRELMRRAGKSDLYLSDISPLGVPFNLVHNTESVIWTQHQVANGKPGSGCPKGFLALSTELTDLPTCPASRVYQKRKRTQIEAAGKMENDHAETLKKIHEKTCLCEHLGNGILIGLGIENETNAPSLVCPGPNLAWFDRLYSLQEMVDHIYGRISSLVPHHRPHMFANEIILYVDYFEKLIHQCNDQPKEIKTLVEYRDNLERGMDLCLEISNAQEYPGENLSSILPCVTTQRIRLNAIWRRSGLADRDSTDTACPPLAAA